MYSAATLGLSVGKFTSLHYLSPLLTKLLPYLCLLMLNSFMSSFFWFLSSFCPSFLPTIEPYFDSMSFPSSLSIILPSTFISTFLPSILPSFSPSFPPSLFHPMSPISWTSSRIQNSSPGQLMPTMQCLVKVLWRNPCFKTRHQTDSGLCQCLSWVSVSFWLLCPVHVVLIRNAEACRTSASHASQGEGCGWLLLVTARHASN